MSTEQKPDDKPDTVELLPCPFCGAGPNLLRFLEEEVVIQCIDCRARGPFFVVTEEQARRAWNKRAKK